MRGVESTNADYEKPRIQSLGPAAIVGSNEAAKEPMMDCYVTLAVRYEPSATVGQRSLGWLAAELRDAPLPMTRDEDDVRQWSGVIDDATYARLVAHWRLDEKAGSHRNVFDGMNWESDGWSPVVWASLSVEPVGHRLAA
jgi:hypothetical protein